MRGGHGEPTNDDSSRTPGRLKFRQSHQLRRSMLGHTLLSRSSEEDKHGHARDVLKGSIEHEGRDILASLSLPES